MGFYCGVMNDRGIVTKQIGEDGSQEHDVAFVAIQTTFEGHSTNDSGGTPWTVIIDKKGKVRCNDFLISTAKAAETIEKLKRD